MKKFIISIFIFTFLVFMVESFIYFDKKNIINIDTRTPEAIWVEKENSIKNFSENADILFLGDSTVNRAIDENLFSISSGLSSINLGVTGDFITYADYAMLKKYLKIKKNIPPKAIVIWHTFDVWAKKMDYNNFCLTSPEIIDTLYELKIHGPKTYSLQDKIMYPVNYAELFIQPLFTYLPSYKYKVWIKKSLSNNIPLDSNDELNKILPQKKEKNQIAKQVKYFSNWQFYISNESKIWFKKTVNLAAQYDIKIYTARSPVNKAFIDNSSTKEMLDNSNALLTAFYNNFNNVKMLNKTNPVFTDEMGSVDKDHVNEKGEKYLTLYYSNMIKNLLKGSSKVESSMNFKLF